MAVLLGVIIQVGLGYSVAGGATRLKEIHTYVGYVGPALGVILTVVAWKSKTATAASKGLMATFLITLVIQVWMGQDLLLGSLRFVRYHEALGILLFVLAMGEAAVTSMSARRRHKNI